MRAHRSRQGAVTVLVAVTLALTACGRESPVTQAPDPPAWFVGERDRTVPAPPLERPPSLVVGDSAFEPATIFVRPGEAARIENTGTSTLTLDLDGVVVAVVEPGASRLVSIDLRPGRYEISSREDPSIHGTLVVT
jgi:Cupredoxin-like domain